MRLSVLNTSAESVVRHGMPFALAAICLYSAPQILNNVSFPDVIALVGTLPVWVWIVAILFTMVSFQAVGQYDVLAKRHLNVTGSDARTRQNGMIAVALSQTLGFGLITGSLVRYRLRPDEGVMRAGQVTGLVTLFFLIGLLVVVALVSFISDVGVYRAAGVVGFLGLVVCITFIAVFRPRIRFRQNPISIPGLSAITASIFWAIIDVLAAGAAFYVLLPPDVQVGFFTILPVFCLALAAGILSGVPGGVGPFELVLLSLTAPEMPTYVDPTCLMTAIFGFRFIYYLLPAVFAALFVLRPTRVVKDMQIVPLSARSGYPPRAETGVIGQNGGSMISLATGAGALWPAGNSLIALFDPTRPICSVWLRAFRDHARARSFFPVIYKCSARNAAAVRKEGWCVVNVAKDAILRPAKFELKGSKLAGLRRKLRKAKNAGVTVRLCHSEDISDLERIDRAWQERCGAARGGTMGRFCPHYLENQMVLVAEHNDHPVAFISLHKGKVEWALDLMRDGPVAPDGTMYLLVHAAIQMAAAEGILRLSLAAVPTDKGQDQGFNGKLLCLVREKYAARGLYQFKSAFAPQWQPLYMAAPNRIGLCLGAIDLLREILRPGQVYSTSLDIVPQVHSKSQGCELDA